MAMLWPMQVERCGQYVLHQKLNEGGMAEVYIATDPQQQTVIVRKLLGKFKLNLFKRREFSRGLEVQSLLQHPNIVKVLKLATLSPVPYAIMEFVDGPNLRVPITQRQTALETNVPIFAELLKALSHVHTHGYLHLDFKPENILITHRGHVKLLDFDLSEKVGKIPKAQSEIKGTPAYLAPEQIAKLPVDERTDIFALGLTAFELFTGQKPFPSSDRNEVFRAISSETPFPSARSINSDIPHALDRLIAGCIEKSPEKRYPTVGMIARDLQKVGHLV